MTHVVTESCIKCKYTDCVDVCPVDCFREGPNFLSIDPDECIDCAVCIPECPVNAIFAEEDVPEDQRDFIKLNVDLSKQWPSITRMAAQIDPLGFPRAVPPELSAEFYELSGKDMVRFEGSSTYVATDDLKLAVNAALTLQRPLLIKGEPGTGKTMLAEEVATALGMPLMQWHIKSTTKAQQGLYEYDAVSRLRDSQLADVDGGERVRNIHNYIVRGVLWQAFTADQPVVLLIDEIDKADIEFPNDLLLELDRMEFHALRS